MRSRFYKGGWPLVYKIAMYRHWGYSGKLHDWNRPMKPKKRK